MEPSQSESIPALDDVINGLDHLFRELEQTKSLTNLLEHRIKDLRAHRKGIACGRGMNSLSPETIGEIFVFAAGDSLWTALKILHTSSKWRRIALSTPALWSRVTFGYGYRSPKLLAMCLGLSKVVPLRIRYTPGTTERFSASFPLLIAHAHRWRTFEAEMPAGSTAMETLFERLPAPATLPVLEELSLRYTDRPIQSRPLPPFCLPALRKLNFYATQSSVNFRLVGPNLKDLGFHPTSLAGMDSCMNLRIFRCHIRGDLIIESNLRLVFPCLEEVFLRFFQVAWPVVSRLLQAMAACSPTEFRIDIDPQREDDSFHGPALDPPKTFLSKVKKLVICTYTARSPVNYGNTQQILERCPELIHLNVGMDLLGQLLGRMARTFPRNVTKFDLSNLADGRKLARGLIKLLEHRLEEGVPRPKYVRLADCSSPSKNQTARLKELVEDLHLCTEDYDDIDYGPWVSMDEGDGE